MWQVNLVNTIWQWSILIIGHLSKLFTTNVHFHKSNHTWPMLFSGCKTCWFSTFFIARRHQNCILLFRWINPDVVRCVQMTLILWESKVFILYISVLYQNRLLSLLFYFTSALWIDWIRCKEWLKWIVKELHVKND